MPKHRHHLLSAFNREAPVPAAPRDDTVDIYHGVKIKDPFRPLEDLDSAETAVWAAAQNERFSAFIAGTDAKERTTEFLRRIWDYPKESTPGHYGDKYFSSFQDGLAPQAVYQVRDALDAPPRVLIDPNTLSADGTVALSGVYPSPDGTLVAYLTSEAGSDEQTLRIRDVATGTDLPDVITGLRFTGAGWDKDSSKGFSYVREAGDGRGRFVSLHHTIGDDPAADQKLFELEDSNSFTYAFHLDHGSYEGMNIIIGCERANGIWLREAGSGEPYREIFPHLVASYDPIDEVDGRIYMVTDFQAPMGQLVSFDPAHPEPENWQTILPEMPEDSLASAFIHQGKLFANYVRDCADQLRVYDLQGAHQYDIDIPVQSTFSIGHANEDDASFLMRISNFQQPGALYEYDIAKNDLALIKPSAAVETLTDCIVERIEAVSKDGTKIPMTVIRSPQTQLDGTAAVKLYGYGGFNQSLGPAYGVTIASWIRSGGIFVQANLRGGGEYGSAWYDQGRLLNKQNVFDDFAACAETLIDRNYTSAERLVSNGGSNGGLLVLAAMLQRPELFGAVVSEVPVTDMFRFHKHTFGANWISDYGDPDNDRAAFEASRKYSPLHTIKKGGAYPPCLVTTADHDDRVVPSHAFKFAATLQEKESPDSVCVLRVETRAGHGAGKPTDKVIEEEADIQAFIEKAIGPVDQQAYKASLERVKDFSEKLER